MKRSLASMSIAIWSVMVLQSNVAPSSRRVGSRVPGSHRPVTIASRSRSATAGPSTAGRPDFFDAVAGLLILAVSCPFATSENSSRFDVVIYTIYHIACLAQRMFPRQTLHQTIPSSLAAEIRNMAAFHTERRARRARPTS